MSFFSLHYFKIFYAVPLSSDIPTDSCEASVVRNTLPRMHVPVWARRASCTKHSQKGSVCRAGNAACRWECPRTASWLWEFQRIASHIYHILKTLPIKSMKPIKLQRKKYSFFSQTMIKYIIVYHIRGVKNKKWKRTVSKIKKELL